LHLLFQFVQFQDWLYTQFEWFGSSFQRLIGVPISDRYNNVFFAGIVGSIFSFLQYLSSPIFGALSDVYGRKPILMFSVLGTLASYYVRLFWTQTQLISSEFAV
jgi:MFS family permease